MDQATYQDFLKILLALMLNEDPVANDFSKQQKHKKGKQEKVSN